MAEAVRTELKRTIGVKRATDEEVDSIESIRGAYEKNAPESRAKIAKYAADGSHNGNYSNIFNTLH